VTDSLERRRDTQPVAEQSAAKRRADGLEIRSHGDCGRTVGSAEETVYA
jgi:hypothetical protein